MFYSPLRYPGGKNKLAILIADICVKNKIRSQYIEPYAGGASVALNLLITDKVESIIINDLDRSIYAFWYCVLKKTNKFCDLIEKTPINIFQWKKQKEIQKNKEKNNLLELGFSTFFLNRTNYSGIIQSGVIGGIKQKGKYKLDCRFNKKKLIEKIKLIASYKNKIKLYKYDAVELIQKIRKNNDNKNIIFYFDPPYYVKGPDLYTIHYKKEDHLRLAQEIKKIKKAHWIITYDDHSFIKDLYKWVKNTKDIQLRYCLKIKRLNKEIMFLSNSLT